eukprot:7878664-Karenia_brevis.AAC.1
MPGPPGGPGGPGTEPSSGNGGGWTQPSASTGPSPSGDGSPAGIPIHISKATAPGSTTGPAPGEVYLPINEQANMGFTAPTLIQAHPPGQMPGVIGMGNGAAGGPNGPPW